MDASSRSFMRWVAVIQISSICLLPHQSKHHEYQHSVAILPKTCLSGGTILTIIFFLPGFRRFAVSHGNGTQQGRALTNEPRPGGT